MQRPLLVGRERQVAADHDALGHGGVAAEPDLGGDAPLVDVAAARERRLLAVDGDRDPRRGAVLERAADQARRDDGAPVVREPGGSALGELDHLGQLRALLALGDRREEADRHVRLRLRALGERPEHGRRVDDRVGVGHGEDRAVPARRGGASAGAEVLLVLAAGRAEVDVRVDERRREHLAVASRRGLDAGDHPLLDGDGQGLVDPLRRVDHPHRLEGERVLPAVPRVEHHATSSISATLTSTGPWVRRS